MLYIDEHIYGFDLQAALSDISEQRRAQALRYRHELGQRTCVLAYLLLKRALQTEYGLSCNPQFEYGPHGKPSLVGYPDIYFSLSHCRQAVACAVGDRPLGVDVESIGRYNEGLVRYTMNDREQAFIEAAPQPDVAFIRLWTMKEALLKLTGEGITDDIKHALDNASSYRFTTVERQQQGYVYTVCSGEQTQSNPFVVTGLTEQQGGQP